MGVPQKKTTSTAKKPQAKKPQAAVQIGFDPTKLNNGQINTCCLAYYYLRQFKVPHHWALGILANAWSESSFSHRVLRVLPSGRTNKRDPYVSMFSGGMWQCDWPTGAWHAFDYFMYGMYVQGGVVYQKRNNIQFLQNVSAVRVPIGKGQVKIVTGYSSAPWVFQRLATNTLWYGSENEYYMIQIYMGGFPYTLKEQCMFIAHVGWTQRVTYFGRGGFFSYKNVKTAGEAARTFVAEYERPADTEGAKSSRPKLVPYVEKLLTMYYPNYAKSIKANLDPYIYGGIIPARTTLGSRTYDRGLEAYANYYCTWNKSNKKIYGTKLQKLNHPFN